uniref:Protoheme IX farnesyltransferase, mitochondrial n=1 Tax=Mesocestoides corti TaxID=53468 RepID=A0A5K3EQW6_MESCO
MSAGNIKKSRRTVFVSESNRRIGLATPGSIERLKYLEALVNELCVTKSINCKQQIVANLGNFAHDPRNCSQLLSLDIPSIFLEIVREHLHITKTSGLYFSTTFLFHLRITL